MSFPSESDMVSKELQNSDLIYVNLMADVFKIIVKYGRKIIAKYRHLSPSGNRALTELNGLWLKLKLETGSDNDDDKHNKHHKYTLDEALTSSVEIQR